MSCLTVPGVAQVSENNNLNQESSLSGERPQQYRNRQLAQHLNLGCCSKASTRRNRRGGKVCGEGLSKLFSSLCCKNTIDAFS